MKQTFYLCLCFACFALVIRKTMLMCVLVSVLIMLNIIARFCICDADYYFDVSPYSLRISSSFSFWKQMVKLLSCARKIHIFYWILCRSKNNNLQQNYRNYPMFSDTLWFWTPPIFHRKNNFKMHKTCFSDTLCFRTPLFTRK